MEGKINLFSSVKENGHLQGSENQNAELSSAPEHDIIDKIDQHLNETFIIPYSSSSRKMDSTFVVSDKGGFSSSVDISADTSIASFPKDDILVSQNENELHPTVDKIFESSTSPKTAAEVSQCDTAVEGESNETGNSLIEKNVMRTNENDDSASQSPGIVDDASTIRHSSDICFTSVGNIQSELSPSATVKTVEKNKGNSDLENVHDVSSSGNLEGKENSEIEGSTDAGQFSITPCLFASLSAENSKDSDNELTKFVHQDVSNAESVDLTETNSTDIDPFAQMQESNARPECDILMEVDGDEPADDYLERQKTSDVPEVDKNAPSAQTSYEIEPELNDSFENEIITGDKSIAPEVVLANPDVDVCIIEDPKVDDGKKSGSSEQVTSDHAYTRSASEGSKKDDSNDVEIVTEIQPSTPTPTPKKTLKVLYPKKRNDSSEVLVTQIPPVLKACLHCSLTVSCTIMIEINGKNCYLCSDPCLIKHRSALKKTLQRISSKRSERKEPSDFVRKCAECKSVIIPSDKTLSWETMDFCVEECLAKYQGKFGSLCANCNKDVHSMSLGKYCVRFGYNIKQFCQSSCLEEFKKGLKICSYCQKDISNSDESFLAAVGDSGQFKDFCSQNCLEKYEVLAHNRPATLDVQPCDVCAKEKVVQVEVRIDSKTNKLCSEVCFAAFKFVNTITVGVCDMCKRYFDKASLENDYTIFYEDDSHSFCSKSCMNVYIIAKRKIVPCGWCKVRKYNFDMIKKTFGVNTITTCSLNCLALYQVSLQAMNSRTKHPCDKCGKIDFAIYHLTMSDATLRNFCCYRCVVNFQAMFKNRHAPGSSAQPTPAGLPKRILSKSARPTVTPGANSSPQMPVISSVGSLVPANGTSIEPLIQNSTMTGNIVPNKQVLKQQKQQVLVKPPPPKQYKNKVTQVKPNYCSKGTTCKPHRVSKDVQTEEIKTDPILIPIPIPIYVPVPLAMYNIPVPTPTPFPLPVPVPVFIPTTRNSAKGILQEIKRIQDKIPSDPFEAELLMMAKMVAADKMSGETSSDSDHDASEPVEPSGSSGSNAGGSGGEFNPEVMESSNTFGDDMLQIALKIASELEEPPVDLDSAVASNTPAVTQQSSSEHQDNENKCNEGDSNDELRQSKKRGHPADDTDGRNVQMGVNRSGSENDGANLAKRQRRNSPIDTVGSTVSGGDSRLIPSNQPSAPMPKPDATMCLKYTLGVNAWKHWVNGKNMELEKSAAASGRKAKLLKTEILQQTPDELNYSLSLFVKEVKKPDGSEHTPDTIYYLCLGIQEYLYQNGRVDNIFTDLYYEKFTSCLNTIAKKFTSLYDQQLVVTRVEEEHLWESKQLGVSTPCVLLTTLMYFNTKYFNLATVEEHKQLSFSHIMKHWKKNNPNAPPGSSVPGNGSAKTQGSRNVLLRFYPPQSVLEANPKKKKVYEQEENEENRYRCPVKLYEFYLSKCPDNVKSRNDVFYLKPECSCVPDSPVWYSNSPLEENQLGKILNMIKMVKEINIALLSP